MSEVAIDQMMRLRLLECWLPLAQQLNQDLEWGRTATELEVLILAADVGMSRVPARIGCQRHGDVRMPHSSHFVAVGIDLGHMQRYLWPLARRHPAKASGLARLSAEIETIQFRKPQRDSRTGQHGEQSSRGVAVDQGAFL